MLLFLHELFLQITLHLGLLDFALTVGTFTGKIEWYTLTRTLGVHLVARTTTVGVPTVAVKHMNEPGGDHAFDNLLFTTSTERFGQQQQLSQRHRSCHFYHYLHVLTVIRLNRPVAILVKFGATARRIIVCVHD